MSEMLLGVDDVDGAADALLARWEKKPEPKQPTEERQAPPPKAEREEPVEEREETEEVEHDEAPEEETEEGSAEGEGEEGDEHPEPKVADDDHEVVISINGEAKRIPVKELKALFGKQAEIDTRSAAIARAETAAQEAAQRHNAGLQKLLKQAEDRWKPFADIDFLIASKNMSAEEFTALRGAAQAAYQDVNFLKQELDAAVRHEAEARQTSIREQALACVKELSDPAKGIKGWGEPMYNELRTFAVENGMKADTYNQLVDPTAFRLLHMAHQFAKAQKVGVKKVAQAPKNVAQKEKTTGTGTTPQTMRSRKAIDKLRVTGNTDDAAEALMSRWGVRE